MCGAIIPAETQASGLVRDFLLHYTCPEFLDSRTGQGLLLPQPAGTPAMLQKGEVNSIRMMVRSKRVQNNTLFGTGRQYGMSQIDFSMIQYDYRDIFQWDPGFLLLGDYQRMAMDT